MSEKHSSLALKRHSMSDCQIVTSIAQRKRYSGRKKLQILSVSESTNTSVSLCDGGMGEGDRGERDRDSEVG